MPKASPILQAFNGGELSPFMDGRTDHKKYFTGCKVLENFIPHVQGAAERRPGTRFVAPVKDSAKATRIVRFEFSVTQAYVIEFGDLYCRFYREHGAILEAGKAMTGATQANPVVVTAAAHGFANGDEIYISGAVGMTQLNGQRFIVANQATNTFELAGIDGTGFSAYVSGGAAARVYTVTTPYAEADLFELKFSQSADILYITHPSYAPRKLSRTGHTAWTLTVIDFLDGPYLSVNTGATTLAPSATTGSITITASAAAFAATDVGRLVRIQHSAHWGYAKITAFTDTTHVTADVKNSFGATTASKNWRLGSWSDTTGWPACSTFYEDRLFFGGEPLQRLDGSKSGDYENFAPSADDSTVADDNALAFTLNANDVNVIRWMIDDENGLIIGTVGGEWILRPSNQNEALTPTNVKATRTTTRGSSNYQPVKAGKAVLFVQRAGRKVFELAFVFADDNYKAPDMTALAEHITKGGLGEIAYQPQPSSIVWGVRGDGVLLGFTYERDQDVVGWHRPVLGGHADAGKTQPAAVESVAVIPAPDGDRDELWLVVRRSIDGTTRRYVEFLEALWDPANDQRAAFFVDSGLTYDGAPTSTIGGLDHLEGETVSILADGATHPDKTVSQGRITLDRDAAVVQVGLAYTSTLQTMKLEAGAADGTAQGKTKRISKVVFNFYQTLGGLYGAAPDGAFDVLQFRTASDPLDAPPPLFDGMTRPLNWPMGYETAAAITVRQVQPLPMTLLAIMPQVSTQDR